MIGARLPQRVARQVTRHVAPHRIEAWVAANRATKALGALGAVDESRPLAPTLRAVAAKMARESWTHNFVRFASISCVSRSRFARSASAAVSTNASSTASRSLGRSLPTMNATSCRWYPARVTRAV